MYMLRLSGIIVALLMGNAVFALSLSVETFDKTTGQYIQSRSWTVQQDIYDWPWATPLGNRNYTAVRRGLALDPDGSVWVGNIGTITHWATDGTLIGTFTVPGTTAAWPNVASRLSVLDNSLYVLCTGVGVTDNFDTDGRPHLRSNFTVQQLSKVSGSVTGTWTPPYEGGEYLDSADACDLVVDPTRQIGGVAVWVHYQYFVSDSQETITFLAGLEDNIPAGQHALRFITGKIGTMSPLCNQIERSWDTYSFFILPKDSSLHMIGRLTPGDSDQLMGQGNIFEQGSHLANLCSDQALQHLFLLPNDGNRYLELSDTGTQVRYSAPFPFAAHDDVAHNYYTYDIATDNNYVYVLLLTERPL